MVEYFLLKEKLLNFQYEISFYLDSIQIKIIHVLLFNSLNLSYFFSETTSFCQDRD